MTKGDLKLRSGTPYSGILKTAVLFFLILLPVSGISQENIPVGTWRSHTSYSKAVNVTSGDNKVFCQTEFGLFFLDMEDGSLNTITTNDDISSVNFSDIGFLNSTETLLIAYEDGDLDFWREDELINFSAIATSSIIGDRAINDIEENDGLTYLSTGFGVVVIDPFEIIVDEAYIGLGPSGEQIEINGSTFFRDTVFLATNSGVISASLSPSVNRLDFNVWDRNHVSGNSSVSHIELFNDTLYASVNDQFLFQYFNGQWNETTIPVNGNAFELKEANNNLFLISDSEVTVIQDSRTFETLNNQQIISPRSIEILNNDQTFLADFQNGLLDLSSTGANQIIPAGPVSNQATDLFSINGTTLAVHGVGPSSGVSQTIGGFSLFQLGGWSIFENPQRIPVSDDLVAINFNSVSSRAQFASFGAGILDWDFSEEFVVINDETPGSTLSGSNPSGEVLISDVKSDGQGNLWITNFDSDLPLHKLNLNGEWEAFSFNFPESRFPKQLLVASTGDIWIILEDQGILVFNEETDSFRRLTTSASNGNLPSSRINNMIEDLDGQIWLATEEGVAAFPFPFDIINNDQAQAFIPIIDGRLLFEEENVTEIAVDGGDRKWMTTRNGIFLFNQSVSELETSFDMENSPLLSNNIMDMSIDNTTGEVFFSTDRGLISYRGTATLGGTTHESVRVFPNPVPADFEGLVGISGLANAVNVKITDISGKLVREVLSNGGTAVWDSRDLNGRKVQSGIYLILSSTQDGEENFAGKFAVVE